MTLRSLPQQPAFLQEESGQRYSQAALAQLRASSSGALVRPPISAVPVDEDEVTDIARYGDMAVDLDGEGTQKATQSNNFETIH